MSLHLQIGQTVVFSSFTLQEVIDQYAEQVLEPLAKKYRIKIEKVGDKPIKMFSLSADGEKFSLSGNIIKGDKNKGVDVKNSEKLLKNIFKYLPKAIAIGKKIAKTNDSPFYSDISRHLEAEIPKKTLGHTDLFSVACDVIRNKGIKIWS